MTTFDVLLKCFPFFVFLGIGVHLLMTALVPSWREKGWNHWKVFEGYDGNNYNEKSWLVQLGFVQLPKPIAEGDFKLRTAVRLYFVAGVIFTLIGIVGTVMIVLQSIQN